MLKPIYHFELGHTISNDLIAVGKYDGQKPTLAYVSVGGKVNIFSPYEKLLTTDTEFKFTTNEEYDIIYLIT